MKCNLMAWLRKENEDIPAFPIGAPFRPKEVGINGNQQPEMVACNSDEIPLNIDPIEEELPDGVYQTANGYGARCVCCDNYKEIFVDISKIPKIGYKHYCGGSPSCLP